MQTVTQHLRNGILASIGMSEEETPERLPDLDTLKRTEWSPRFERLMRNRLIMGAFRYGRLHHPNRPNYDYIAGIIRHAEAYQEDGNLEHLVDIANIALVEFEEGPHPLKHFKGIDDGEHVQALARPSSGSETATEGLNA